MNQANGITPFDAVLECHGEPCELNVSFSDVLGSLAKQYTLRQDATKAEWLIGIDPLKRKENGNALHSIK
jgi:Zn-dependent metalloprotease